MTHDSIRHWLDVRRDEMVALVERLVAVETPNPPGTNLRACAAILAGAMAEMGIDADVIELEAAGALTEPCVVRGAVGDGPRTIYFHGHFDVVPAQSPSQFRPARHGGKIVGRGTADMKGGLASMIYGAAAASSLGLLGGTQVVFHFVCDEETGSNVGSQHLRDHDLIKSEALAMLTAEPTGGAIWHASRGAITMLVSVAGREAHVGHAHRGDNAFEKVLGLAGPISVLGRELAERRTLHPTEQEADRGSKLVVGGASGSGSNFNVVPGHAWFSIDRRLNPEEDLVEETERLRALLTDAATQIGAEIEIKVLQHAPASVSNPDSRRARVLERCVATAEGVRPAFLLCPGVLETRWYTALGVPAFAYGPGRLDVAHGPNEYVDEAAVLRAAAAYALFAASASE